MKNLAVIYGGATTEHEVSVITAVQLMKHVDKKKYNLIPVYTDKAGKWWTGDKLTDIKTYRKLDLMKPKGLKEFNISPVRGSNDIDAAILCFHGGYGESGNLQGLLELAGIPYQGPEVLGSATAFDKITTRQILTAEDIGQTDYMWFTDKDWEQDQAGVLKKVKALGMPVFIKPSRSGSSIGIERVTDEKKLVEMIEQVLTFDWRILVEAEIKDCIEVNVSVMGGDETRASVTEQPITADEFLSYADKYERGGGGKKGGMAGATRRVPAPISQDLAKKLQSLAQRIFRIFDLTGVVRIDFFADPSSGQTYVTEINTIPGSMSFYLWDPSGVPYPELIDHMVRIAEERYAKKEDMVQTFESNILNKDI